MRFLLVAIIVVYSASAFGGECKVTYFFGSEFKDSPRTVLPANIQSWNDCANAAMAQIVGEGQLAFRDKNVKSVNMTYSYTDDNLHQNGKVTIVRPN